MKKKIFRIFINNGLLFRSLRLILVLFMCLTILWLSGPCQVYASGLAGALYQIAGNIGVNAALRAIGVGPGKSPDAFNTLVTNISDALAPASNFMMDVLIAGTSGNWLTFLRDTFLQSILDYMFDSGVLISGVRVPSDCPDPVLANISEFSSHKYAFIFYSGDTYWASYNDSAPFKIIYQDGYGYGVTIDTSTSFSLYRNGSYSGFATVAWRAGAEYAQFFGTAVGDPISTDEDLSLDTVSPSLDDDSYIPWVENSIFNNGETFVPVSLPSLDSSVVSSQTQTQAQAGIATDAVVDEIIAGSEVVPDTGTGTIADVIAAIKSIPLSLADFFADVVAAVQAIPAAIADVFTPSGTVEAYSLDLKRFLPFCIPYDIYSMLAALAADPVAPKFDFEIDLGPVGILPISVDFSEWDDVAALLRTCEAAIFAVGLAVKTKELIGW